MAKLTRAKKLKVLKLLLEIPGGKLTTYGALAKQTGLHPRTVGRILNQNKRSDLYPCYKVIMNDGKLGGYGGGLEKKIELIRRDGILIKDGKIGEEFIFRNF
ncbi:MAG: methylated-DNA--[protein]-cysteine S-methyltransferase [Candidatus Moranbacteria bacterium]|nr:methylated-DNA--[protein]-cysteine S-methyltransferase [Candidatus Moranbacteria bacterium]